MSETPLEQITQLPQLLQNEHKFLADNIESKGIIADHEFSCIDNIIEAGLMIHGLHGRVSDLNIAYNILSEHTDNMYALVMMSHIDCIRGNHKQGFYNLLKSLDLGYTEALDGITSLFLEYTCYITFNERHINSEKYYYVPLDDFIRILNKLDNVAIAKWISYGNFYDFRNYHALLLSLVMEKNKQIEQIEQLKLQHEKEIEELLRPGNAGALAAEQRFIESAESL